MADDILRTTIAGSLRFRPNREAPVVLSADLLPELGIEFAEPLQCAKPGQKAILASPCDHKTRQARETPGQWTLRKAVFVRVDDRSGDRIFRRPSSEEASVIHPLRLDELELPPQIGPDKCEHQTPFRAIIFQNPVRKQRSIRRSTTNHAVDAHYPRYVCVAWIRAANVRAARRLIADGVVFFEKESVIPSPVGSEFRIIVHWTEGERRAATPTPHDFRGHQFLVFRAGRVRLQILPERGDPLV